MTDKQMPPDLMLALGELGRRIEALANDFDQWCKDNKILPTLVPYIDSKITVRTEEDEVIGAFNLLDDFVIWEPADGKEG